MLRNEGLFICTMLRHLIQIPCCMNRVINLRFVLDSRIQLQMHFEDFVLAFMYSYFNIICSVGTSYKPSTTDYATRHSGLEPFYQVSSAVGGASQMQQDRLGFSQPYGYTPPFSYSQAHQLPQPTPSTSWPQFSHLPPVSYHQHFQSQHPQPSTNQSQFSQLQACTGYNNAGNISIISVNLFLD